MANITNITDITMDGDLLADEFNDCIIGVATMADGTRRVIYSADQMVRQVTNDFHSEAMDLDEAYRCAVEYLEHNTFCAYVGKQTPIYLWDGSNEA